MMPAQCRAVPFDRPSQLPVGEGYKLGLAQWRCGSPLAHGAGCEAAGAEAAGPGEGPQAAAAGDPHWR
jgi:hypothetical protein